MRYILLIFLIFLVPTNLHSKVRTISCDVPKKMQSDFTLYRYVNEKWQRVTNLNLNRRIGDKFAVYLDIATGRDNEIIENGHALIKISHYKQSAIKEPKIAENVTLLTERRHPRQRGISKLYHKGKISTKSYQEYHSDENSPRPNKLHRFHTVKKGAKRYRKYVKQRKAGFAFDKIKVVKDQPRVLLGGLNVGKKSRLQNNTGYEVFSLSASLRYVKRQKKVAILPLCFEIGEIDGVIKTRIAIIDFDGIPRNLVERWRGRNKVWNIFWR